MNVRHHTNKLPLIHLRKHELGKHNSRQSGQHCHEVSTICKEIRIVENEEEEEDREVE